MKVEGKIKELGTLAQACYDIVVDIADKIYKKHQGGAKETSSEDKKAIIKALQHYKNPDIHREMLAKIQEEVISGHLKIDILKIACWYTGYAKGGNFMGFYDRAKTMHAVISKLTPEEMKKLETEDTYLGETFVITPKNCNKVLEVSRDNQAITLSERNNFKKLLFKIGWLEKPAKKEEEITEAKAEVQRPGGMIVKMPNRPTENGVPAAAQG